MDGALAGVLVPVDALEATEGAGELARLLLTTEPGLLFATWRLTVSDIVKGGAAGFEGAGLGCLSAGTVPLG